MNVNQVEICKNLLKSIKAGNKEIFFDLLDENVKFIKKLKNEEPQLIANNKNNLKISYKIIEKELKQFSDLVFNKEMYGENQCFFTKNNTQLQIIIDKNLIQEILITQLS